MMHDPHRHEWQRPDEILKAMALAPAMTVADVGAGAGFFATRLARAVPDGQVIATDVDPAMRAHIDKLAQTEGLANLRTAMSLLPASVDRILVVHAWHHMSHRHHVADELRSALKPGGRLFVVDYTLEAAHGPPHHMRVSHDAVIAELSAAGFFAKLVPVAIADQYLVEASAAATASDRG